MLTRHFYELEEVEYALIDCLRKRQVVEALFWARELILSEEADKLTITVVQAWIMFMGAASVDWLDAWFAATDSSSQLSLIESFCQRAATHNKQWLTFWIAARGFSPTPSDERVALALDENDPICLYWWLGQQYEKKPSLVLGCLTTFVDSPEIFDSIKKAMALKMGLHMKTLLSVCAVQILCLKSYSCASALAMAGAVASASAEAVSSWTVGLRCSRLYTIREEQLPRGYKRVTQAEALCHSPFDLMKKGCSFWQRIAASVVSDESLESIVDTYFRDDSPDEWSIFDRSKSHPVKLDIYSVTMSPEYIIKLVWAGRIPVIKRSWYLSMKLLFKACRLPDR